MSHDDKDILKKLNLEDGVLESQVDADFTFLISPSTTVGTDARLLAHTIKNLIFREIRHLRFESPITGFVVFPLINDPEILERKDFISYKRKDKCFYLGMEIPYEKWMDANLLKRVDLLTDSLITSLERVPVKYLLLNDKEKLISTINNVRDYLTK